MTSRRIRHIGVAVLVVLLLISTTVLAAPYGSRTLYRGTFGGDVVELQRRLGSLGYEAGTADGVFGDETRAAVVEFQKDYGLVPDGLADKWTFRAVDRAYTWKQGFFYTVVPGDTLWAISQANDTKVETIKWLNQLQDDMLYPGQALRLPPNGRSTTPVEPAPDPVIPTPGPSPTPGTATAPPPGEVIPGGTGTTDPAEPGAPVTTDPSTQPKYTVLGYYAEDWIGDRRSLDSLRTAAARVNVVVNFQLQLKADGSIQTRDYPELMAEAKSRNLPVQGLVHNFAGSGFDADVARTVLSSPELRARTVASLAAVAREKGLSGINVDIENVPPDQRPGYTAFVKELKEGLQPHGLALTISIPAKTFDDTRSAWSGAFDYKALGQYADHVIPMAYDEHLPGYYAGPVASYGWVNAVARFAASQMDPQKVLLGMAAYAYDWKSGTTQGIARSVPQAMSVAAKYGAEIQWDGVAQVPYYSYTNDKGEQRIVYFENAQSMAAKLDIVKSNNLAGIAMWRMGLEDPAVWQTVADNLLK